MRAGLGSMALGGSLLRAGLVTIERPMQSISGPR